ncbi:hypothetical protein NL676_038675 [Syzygium grande]|nr:hypothetical protein NL676_038675 [Syzygium grande]
MKDTALGAEGGFTRALRSRRRAGAALAASPPTLSSASALASAPLPPPPDGQPRAASAVPDFSPGPAQEGHRACRGDLEIEAAKRREDSLGFFILRLLFGQPRGCLTLLGLLSRPAQEGHEPLGRRSPVGCSGRGAIWRSRAAKRRRGGGGGVRPRGGHRNEDRLSRMTIVEVRLVSTTTTTSCN